jgi:hypothetical protein
LEVTTIRFHAGEIEVQQRADKADDVGEGIAAADGKQQNLSTRARLIGELSVGWGECGTSDTGPAPLAGKLKNRRQ